MLTLFVVQTVASAFAATSGLLFNGYILSVLIWQKRIQNANNLFLLNLAIVDILFCLTVLFGNTSLSIAIGSNLSTSISSPSLSSSELTSTASTETIISSSSSSSQQSLLPDDEFKSTDSIILNQQSSSSYPDPLTLSDQLIRQKLHSPLSSDQLSDDIGISIVPTFTQDEILSPSPSSSSTPPPWIIYPKPLSLLSLVTNFQGYLWTAFPIIFVWTVAGLTIDKYIAISSPLHYSRLITTRKATIALATSWLMGLTLAFPPLIPSSTGCSYTYSLYRSSATITCDTSTYPWFGLVYIVIYILFSILLPLLAITICNFHILLIAENHRHRIITAIYEITLRGGVGNPGEADDHDEINLSLAQKSTGLVTSFSPGSPSIGSPLPSSPISLAPSSNISPSFNANDSPPPSIESPPPTTVPTTTTTTTTTTTPPPPPSTTTTTTTTTCPKNQSVHYQHQPVTKTGSSTSSSGKSRSAESLSRRRSRDAFLPVTQLVGSLLFFTTPHYIIFCLETLDRLTVNPIIISLVTLCLILMPTINAYIYGVKSRLIRSTFKRLLHRYLYKQDVSLEIERRLSLRSQGSQNSLFRSHYGRRNSCPILVQTTPSPPTTTATATSTPTRSIRSDNFWFSFIPPTNNTNNNIITTTINNSNCVNTKLGGNNWSPSFLISYGQQQQHQHQQQQSTPTSISLQYPNHHHHYPSNYNYTSISTNNNNNHPILRRQSLCIIPTSTVNHNQLTNNNNNDNDNNNCITIKSSLAYPIHRIFNQQSFNRLLAIDSVVKLSPIEESTITSENV
ncbi:nuclear pore complex protein DDB_G0274915-like [Panonychus citri]|uniref:nuclear pore complex protein DDB_G0274915-like n=1 Tax=Panonychus citri TaxID=50023 RepID=UPI002307553D|nr:nuclear pore complex protein DDB_G0274915-like [Panonychus citri]